MDQLGNDETGHNGGGAQQNIEIAFHFYHTRPSHDNHRRGWISIVFNRISNDLPLEKSDDFFGRRRFCFWTWIIISMRSRGSKSKMLRRWKGRNRSMLRLAKLLKVSEKRRRRLLSLLELVISLFLWYFVQTFSRSYTQVGCNFKLVEKRMIGWACLIYFR